jgi:AbrB family looped-hinge helix DNA binding protein
LKKHLTKDFLSYIVRKVRSIDMEMAEVRSKGQITIPQEIREKMSLRKGDKVIFFEENGKIFFQNSNSVVLSTFPKSMEGAAQEAGFDGPDDVTKYLKQLRKAGETASNKIVYASRLTVA